MFFISVFDALGKPPSGILNGNTIFMGSYDSCKSIQTSTKGFYKSCKILASVLLVSNLKIELIIINFKFKVKNLKFN